MAKHRSQWRLLNYPLRVYIYGWKNRWYYFTKPLLIKKGKQCLALLKK